MQAAEMSFRRRVSGLNLRDRVRISHIQEELGVDPLLLHIERSQLRWFGYLIRQTQNPLEGLYISSGLGMARDPPGEAGECCWGEGSLGTLL